MALVAALVACGGKAKPDDPGQHADKHEGEMAAMPPSIEKFHETIGPRWHAEPGPKRMADTCEAVGQLRSGADAIVAAPAPSGANAAAWSDGGKQLVEAITALDATCQAKDAAAFEPAFKRVHEIFHHVMESASSHGAEHGEHGEHKM